MAQKNSAPLEKQVRNAIKTLADADKPISNENVRQAIGGGSFRDIGPLVKAVKAEMAAKEQASRKAPDMPDDFHDAAAAMWNTAWTLADEIAASERRGHSAKIEKLKAEVDEALSDCGIVEDERDDAQKQVTALEERLEQLDAAFQELTIEHAKLQGRLLEREGDIVHRTKVKPAGKKQAPRNPDDGTQPDMFPKDQTSAKNSNGPTKPETP